MLDFFPATSMEELKMSFFNSHKFHIAVIGLISLVSLGAAYAALHTLSHDTVHDPAWELYADLNDAFAAHWKSRTGVDVRIGLAQTKSGKPVRAVLDGLAVPTLVLAYDVNKLHEKKRFIAPSLGRALLQNAPTGSARVSPYFSTIVFLVRKGNPKELIDWGDLSRPGIEVVTPNPKISENGRWNYLAAWGYALRQPGSSEKTALAFVGRLFANVKSPVIADFVERGIGDVLLVWENEAHLLSGTGAGVDKFEIVIPSMSIAGEPTVSVASPVAARNSMRDVAADYIEYLYTPQAQDIAGRHYYRPRDEQVGAKYANVFPALKLFTIDEAFGGWRQAGKIHFAQGGVLDQIQGN